MSTPTSYGTKYELYNVDFQRGDVRHFFSESDRSAYFNGLGRVNSGTLNSYIRQNEDFTVNKTWADVREANYVRYDNNDGAGWRYAYVDKLEVVSTSATKLYITEDAWQNNMFNFSIHGTRLRGHVDRMHKSGNDLYLTPSLTPEPITASILPQEVETTNTDIVCQWFVLSQPFASDYSSYSPFFGSFFYYFYPVTEAIENDVQVTVIAAGATTTMTFDGTAMFALSKSPYIINSFYSSALPLGVNINKTDGGYTIIVDATVSAVFVETYHDENLGDQQCMRYDISSNYTGAQKAYLTPTNYNWVQNTPSISNIRSSRYEAKLYGHTFRQVEYGIGGDKSVFYYDFMPDTHSFGFPYWNIPTASGMISLVKTPTDYNAGSNGIYFARSIASFQAPIMKDAENMFLASNENRFNAQLTNSLINSIHISGFRSTNGRKMKEGTNISGGLTGVFTTLVDQGALRADLESMPDKVDALGDSINAILTDSGAPYYIISAPKSDELDRIYSYFYTYGYTINEWQEKTHATLRSRYYFDYYLMADDVHVDIDDSNTARQQMQEDLQKGVTFWHWNPTNNDIQHRYENLEMSIYQTQQ